MSALTVAVHSVAQLTAGERARISTGAVCAYVRFILSSADAWLSEIAVF